MTLYTDRQASPTSNKMLLMNSQRLQHLVCSIGIEATMMAYGLMMERATFKRFVDSSNINGLSIHLLEVSLMI